MNDNHKLVIVLVAIIALLAISYSSFDRGYNIITGAQVQQGVTTISEAVIAKNFALLPSTELSSGIRWNNLDPGDSNINADDNVPGGDTLYFITVDPSSNVDVDFCINANADLAAGIDILPLDPNYKWDSDSSAATPDISTATVMPITPSVEAGSEVLKGTSLYFRFWLTVPGGQAAGTYNNNIQFLGIESDGDPLTSPVCP